MFVKPASGDTRFLHHIGNADAFKTELAKPLGSDVRIIYSAARSGLRSSLAPAIPAKARRVCRFARNSTENKICTIRISKVWRTRTLTAVGCRVEVHLLSDGTGFITAPTYGPSNMSVRWRFSDYGDSLSVL